MQAQSSPKPARNVEQLAYSISTTAQMLDLGESTIWKHIKDRKLRVARVGGRTLVLRESIDELLASSAA